MFWLILLIVVAALCALVLFLVAPAAGRKELRTPFAGRNFAHRGGAQVHLKTVAGKVGADILGIFNCGLHCSAGSHAFACQAHRRRNRASQADSAKGKRPRLPQTRFGNCK